MREKEKNGGDCFSALRKSVLCSDSEPSDVHDPEVINRTRTLVRSACVNQSKKSHKEKSKNTTVGSSDSILVEGSIECVGTDQCLKTNIGNEIVVVHDDSAPSAKENSCRRMAEGVVVPRGNYLETSMSEDSRKGYVYGSTHVICQVRGKQHKQLDAFQSRGLSKYEVSALAEGDSSRKIVEKICETQPEPLLNHHSNSNTTTTKIERVLKVHNTQSVLTCFEDYRESVKLKARRNQSKQRSPLDPRCLADGNELLRFFATTVDIDCSNSGLCHRLDKCGACRILRNGFSSDKDFVGPIGIFVTSSTQRALECVQGEAEVEGGHFKRKALFVCRVIAGMINGPLRKFDPGFVAGSGFDSLACEVGPDGNVEGLFLLNPKALLPCFLVIFRN